MRSGVIPSILFAAAVAVVAFAHITVVDARSWEPGRTEPRRAPKSLPKRIGIPSLITDEEKLRLTEVSQARREREAKRKVVNSSPTGPMLVNKHLRPESKDSSSGGKIKIPEGLHPDDGYRIERLVHLSANKKPRPWPDHRHNFTTIARWSPVSVANGIRMEINFADAEAQAGIPSDLIRAAFVESSTEWHNIGTGVPRFRFVDAPHLGTPSSFLTERTMRNGLNEFRVYQHENMKIEGHSVLGGVQLWIEKATGYIVEADGFVMLHDHDGAHLQWHTGAGHHHPANRFHLRRVLVGLTGHVLGLGHSHDTDHAMTGVSSPGEPMRISKGDRDGILSLYP